jgi:hypothetical protein
MRRVLFGARFTVAKIPAVRSDVSLGRGLVTEGHSVSQDRKMKSRKAMLCVAALKSEQHGQQKKEKYRLFGRRKIG